MLQLVLETALYLGSYRDPMQLAVAFGMCRAVMSEHDRQATHGCAWKGGQSEAEKAGTRYVFVTHSLGSRMLYDVLLGLHKEGPAGVTLTQAGLDLPTDADLVRIMNSTPVIYMMANQVSLLGLSHLTAENQPGWPGTLTDGGVSPLLISPGLAGTSIPQAYDQHIPINVSDLPKGATSSGATLPNVGLKGLIFSGLLSQRTDQLNIVAFNDINDVLSWGIPYEYERVAATTDLSTKISFTNVYVRNSE